MKSLFKDIDWIRFAKILYYLAILYFTYLMILITMQYIPIDRTAAFLSLKEYEVHLLYYRIAFFTHVYTSILVLLVGLLQFVPSIRLRYRDTHKILGKIYVLLILGFSAPAGFVMGMHGNGGTYARISFCLQAVLWFYFTLKAYLSIRKGQIVQHYHFMILSFALTLSAISLRLFKWIIVHTLALPPMDTYRIVVWLGWMANLFIALGIIYLNKRKVNKY